MATIDGAEKVAQESRKGGGAGDLEQRVRTQGVAAERPPDAPICPAGQGEPSGGLSKPYYRIGEVAAIVGVKPHVLRYWEGEFRNVRPTKSSKGHRVYARRDVETLLRVRGLLHDKGYTIAGARRQLSSDAEKIARSAPLPSARSVTSAIKEELLALRSEIEAFLETLQDEAERS
jgi:DNA-binding transcriptional MerR regulator